MFVHDLFERASSVLFHYTTIPAALKILKSGNFELASVVGNRSEEQYAPKGRPFFLSLTRSVTGDYHRFVGSSGVMFKLNGDWFNHNYVVKPIDYWERAWLHSDGTRSRESEDRVFSTEPTIPNKAIESIHVLLKEQHEYRSPETRQLILSAKQQGFPIFLYTDEAAWRLLDTRHAKSLSQAQDVLKGATPAGYSRKPTDYVKPWIELLTKNNVQHLSDRAQRLLKNIRYYSRPNEDNNLAVDLSNGRKPNSSDRASVVEIIKYMQANRIKSTVDLKNALQAKWDKIINGVQEASGVIATKAQARDPRYSMSLTKDVRPGQIEKNLKAFNLDEDSLQEAFDKPYPIKWEKSDYGDVDALAKLPDGTPLSVMFNLADMSENDWGVEFYRSNSQSVTGEGDAQRVFATVLNAISKFIKKKKPNTLFFSAVKEEDPTGSRTKLYDRLVQRYATQLGYNLKKIDYPEQTGYKLTRNEQKVKEDSENFNGIDISMEIQKDDEYVDDDDYDNQVLYVVASNDGRELGHVLFAFDGEYLLPQDLEVEERYQGQGIAKTMYDYVKSKGYKIRRSGQQTDAGAGFWDKHKPGKNVWEQSVAENFADGKNPGRKGLAKRMGVNTKASVSSLRNTAKHSTGEKARMAHWLANMKAGRAKANKK